MNVIVTAGNTAVPIDRVRVITNIFTGRTGTALALHGHDHGHRVTLLTSHPEVVAEMQKDGKTPTTGWRVISYHTFAEFHKHIEAAIRTGDLDAVIHSAAVSDFQSAGVYFPAPGTQFVSGENRWTNDSGTSPQLSDAAAGKIKSSAPELWLRLLPTPKLVDLIRSDWGFRGILVKFKLEVGVTDDRLLEIAEQSRRQSAADLIVANTLEAANTWAYLGPLAGGYEHLPRAELPARLWNAIERLHRERGHG